MVCCYVGTDLSGWTGMVGVFDRCTFYTIQKVPLEPFNFVQADLFVLFLDYV